MTELATEQQPFRILDLGAHDGFVTNFVARKAKEAGRILHIDGVEANPRGVELFNERAKRDGIPGKCKKGLAENVKRLFKAHSYDAVIAFELIEHVPDVDKFLTIIEAMVKHSGRVYISTPNGTFGAGNNPHHLRALTMIDLFDLLRHRGYVWDALPGPDGVSVISYSPRARAAEAKEIALYVGPGWEQWAPTDIERKGLGGSETAAIRVADELANYGNHVTVYGEVSPGAAGQVVYRHHSTFDPFVHRDLVIVSRIPEIFDRTVNADRKLLWLHDTDCGERFAERYMDQIDQVMCLSEWHENHLLETYPFLSSAHLYRTRNGIEPSYFERPADLERHPHRAVYTSSPDRGLDLLLSWWPRVRERVPDAELHFAYASVYDSVAEKDSRIGLFRDTLRQMESITEGVKNLGSLTQPGVAKEMMQAGVWVAPSYSTPAGVPFQETFCIGAVEAAAAGCRRVMANWGALPERLADGPGFLVDAGEDYAEKFIDSIVYALCNPPIDPSLDALKMVWQEVAADMLAAAFAVPA